ncbi:MAG TPA: hypothetical protein VHZ33_33305 [Trebonia sp.]|jgi:hypothetical protein|nr:hypothetical protein [Trebonia sp.]
MDWVQPVATVLAGLPAVMLDAYRMHRDGSVPEQLETSARQHARELEVGSKRQRDQSLWDTGLRVLEQVELSRMVVERAEGPFGYLSDVEVREQVAQLTDSGECPALLIAPFIINTSGSVSDIIGQPFAYNLAIRSAWQDSPWSSDVGPDVGLITHPLMRTDVDLRRIRALLADMPVILVHGFVDGNRKVRAEVVAWNIIRRPVPGTQLVLQAEEAASALRRRSTSTPDHIMWDFAITPGSPLGSRQVAWANCVPDLPVRFVVAPAFLINGKAIAPQLVYTSAEPPTVRPSVLLSQRSADTPEYPAQNRKQRKSRWVHKKNLDQ